MTAETLSFQAEVSRLLDIVAHALYSDREVFLRELISNAADACDKRRFAALSESGLAAVADYAIRLIPDTAAKTLTIADNGIGMDRADLIGHLGTIARSGTAAFLEQLKDKRGEVSLIGQFGVGFYASFMVADTVTVISRKAGHDQAWQWESDGRSGFTVVEASRDAAGTDIILHLKEDAAEFLDPFRLEGIVKRWSDHVGLPVILIEADKDPRTLNDASALWTRPKNEVTAAQHEAFYAHLSHLGGKPWLTLHSRAEGTIEYQALLYVPDAKPFDLFSPERKHGVKLYVRRVFITDDAADLVPGWLRFLRGVVDSSDLPLNVSRELLQNNPVLGKLRSNLTRKVLQELEKKAKDDDYLTFWENFGSVFKEGLYEDREHRDTLLKLARFRSTAGDGWVDLDSYVARMKEGQTEIYFLTGENLDALKQSPQLEGFAARGIEVLLLADPVDAFWTGTVGTWQDKKLQSVTRGGADLAHIPLAEGAEPPPPPADKSIDNLIAFIKLTLGEAVKDVRASSRLTGSAVCLVAGEHDMDLQLERLLRAHKQIDFAASRVLEINPTHPMIKALAARTGDAAAADRLGDAARLLLDQARIVEGETIADPRAFASRLDAMMALAFAA